MPERSKDIYDRMIKVIGQMRRYPTLSLQQLTRPNEWDPHAPDKAIDPRTVVRLAPSALKKMKGRYVAKKRDNLLRILPIPTATGIEEIGIRGSGQASTLGKYFSAVQKAIRPHGDTTELKKFEGLTIKDADGTTRPLITDLRVLKDLARAGLLSFESLYRRSA